MRSVVGKAVGAVLAGGLLMAVRGFAEGEGYPVRFAGVDAADAEKAEADFLEATQKQYFGQSAHHCASMGSVMQVALLTGATSEKDLKTRADAAAVQAAVDFVAQHGAALGLPADRVEARPVWVPGWGPTVAFVIEPEAGERYSVGRFLAVDAVARVAGDSPAVAQFVVYSFPRPRDLKLPEPRVAADAARAKVVGRPASVAKPDAVAPENVPTAAENLGDARETVQAKSLGPGRFGFRRVWEIDFHAGPAATAPVVGHWFVDAVTGEVVGQDMVPPPVAK